MFKVLIALVLAGPASESSCLDEDTRVEAICSVLSNQQNAWNSGDIPGFMEGYWSDESMRFASGGSVTYGWQATLERYEARYDTLEAMGRLDFSDLSVSLMSDDSAVVFGRWTLYRDSDEPTGLFTLIFRKIDDNWKVVHDHTSSAG